MSASLLALAMLAGLVLLLQYRPNPGTAHGEVAGWEGLWSWTRSLHAWGASLATAAVLVHLSASWLEGWPSAWQPVAWRRGVVALALTLGLVLTGSILAWDQRGWQALLHADAAAGVFGASVADPDNPGGAPLGVVFWSHLGLGALLVAAVVWHLWARREQRRQHLTQSAASARWWALGALATVAAAAAWSPATSGPPPLAGYGGTRPEWPFLWLVPLEDAVGIAAVFLLPVGLAVLWAAPRFSAAWSARRRAAALAVAALALTALSLATLR